MDKNLNQQDYFNLEHIKREVENLTLCCLDLAGIVDQPVDDNGMISVRFTFAAEMIHNAQLAALELAHSYSQIKNYFDDLKDNIAE